MTLPTQGELFETRGATGREPGGDPRLVVGGILSGLVAHKRLHEPAVPDRARWVAAVMMGMLALCLVGLLGRTAWLQTKPSTRVAAMMDSQQRQAELVARRGAITDRRGRPLATSRLAYRLFVDPVLIQERLTFAERVGYELGYPPVAIDRKLAERPGSRYVIIDPRMNEDRLLRYESVDIPGLAIESYTVRDYPQHTLAGQVVGFVGQDGTGLDGLELAWERELAGENGSYGLLRDHRARLLWVNPTSYAPQRNGLNRAVTLDLHLQAVAERELAKAVQRVKAKAGQLVVMDPETGELLALAHYPLFDPASFREADPALRRNRIVTDVFEPGSIFKPVVWAGLTELGVVDPDEPFDCEYGAWRMPNGRTLRDATEKGTLTWSEVLQFSSNIGMAKAAARVSPGELHGIITRFGFGVATGSGLPGEVPGLVHALPRWTSYSMGSIPMGQELSVNGLQILRAFAVFANGGRLVTPTLEPVQDLRPQARGTRVIGPSIASLTRGVMRQAVNSERGTGRLANSELYDLFGKTGTAELPNLEGGGYHKDQYVSSFVAGAPLDRPRLVIGCFIHRPDKSIDHYGGRVAAPAVMAVMEQSLLYLGVPPNEGVDPASAIAGVPTE